MNWIDRTFAALRKTLPAPRQAKAWPQSGAGPQAPTAPGETAWADGLFFGTVPLERWNPDTLVWSRGYDVYRRMLHDDQVRALVSLKQAAVTSRPWRFEVREDTPDQQRCAAFFRYLLEARLEGAVPQALEHLLSSQVYGFSLVEKVYAPVWWGQRLRWGLAALKPRPAESFAFEVDAHGNRTGLWQQQGARRVRLAPERFLHHVNKPAVHAQYGESDLRACYRHWWAKDAILKFWNVYLERMAAGFIHGRITGPMPEAERAELKRVMQNLNAQTSIITPANVELEMVSAPHTDAFERAVTARDRAMAKALLVPNLLGFSDSGQTGSYAQSRTQLETFFHVLNALADSLADVLNEQLFRELALWNFGLADPPRFVFEPLTAQQRREVAEAWQAAVKGGAVNPTALDEAHLRTLLGFPPPAAESAAERAGRAGA